MNKARPSWLMFYGRLTGKAGVCLSSLGPGAELRPCLIEACGYDRPIVIDCSVDYSENMKLTERLRALGNA
jgi:thiamine pyrophosphate-dependent acetolactate synthase large subunit-like protein